MASWSSPVIGVVLPVLLGAGASCVGDAFEAASSGGGGASSAATGTGGEGGAAATSTSSTGGAGVTSTSSTGGGGDATSAGAGGAGVGGTGGDAASTSSEAATTTGAGGGPPLGFCHENAQLHDFCADFDGASLLDGWDDSIFQPPQTGTPDLLVFRSPPVSFRVKSLFDDSGSWGLLSKEHATSAAHSRAEVDVYPSDAVFAEGDNGEIAILAILYDSKAAELTLGSSGFTLRFLGLSSYDVSAPPLPVSTWVRVGIDVTYSQAAATGEVKLTYDGAPAALLDNVQTISNMQATGLTLYVGQIREGPTPPWSVAFDDVTWDIE